MKNDSSFFLIFSLANNSDLCSLWLALISSLQKPEVKHLPKTPTVVSSRGREFTKERFPFLLFFWRYEFLILYLFLNNFLLEDNTNDIKSNATFISTSYKQLKEYKVKIKKNKGGERLVIPHNMRKHWLIALILQQKKEKIPEKCF